MPRKKGTTQETAFDEMAAMLEQLEYFRAWSQLERNDKRHLDLTSAQSADLQDAISHLKKVLNPI